MRQDGRGGGINSSRRVCSHRSLAEMPHAITKPRQKKNRARKRSGFGRKWEQGNQDVQGENTAKKTYWKSTHGSNSNKCEQARIAKVRAFLFGFYKRRRFKLGLQRRTRKLNVPMTRANPRSIHTQVSAVAITDWLVS